MMSTMAVMRFPVGFLRGSCVVGTDLAPLLLQDRPFLAKPVGRVSADLAQGCVDRWNRRPRSGILPGRRHRMSYVQRVLQPGEVVKHSASIHWIVYWPGALCALGAAIAYGYGEMQGHATVFWDWMAALLAIVALVLLVPEC